MAIIGDFEKQIVACAAQSQTRAAGAAVTHDVRERLVGDAQQRVFGRRGQWRHAVEFQIECHPAGLRPVQRTHAQALDERKFGVGAAQLVEDLHEFVLDLLAQALGLHHAFARGVFAELTARGGQLQIQCERFLFHSVVQVARQTLAFGHRRQLRARSHESLEFERHAIEQCRKPAEFVARAIVDEMAEIATAPRRRRPRDVIESSRDPRGEKHRRRDAEHDQIAEHDRPFETQVEQKTPPRQRQAQFDEQISAHASVGGVDRCQCAAHFVGTVGSFEKVGDSRCLQRLRRRQIGTPVGVNRRLRENASVRRDHRRGEGIVGQFHEHVRIVADQIAMRTLQAQQPSVGPGIESCAFIGCGGWPRAGQILCAVFAGAYERSGIHAAHEILEFENEDRRLDENQTRQR